MRKKVIIVANSTWNIYKFRLNLIDKLINEQYDVVVVAPLDEYIEYKEKFPSVRHIPLKNLNRASGNPLRDLRLIVELRNIYKSERPDLIIHYTHKPNIFGGFAVKGINVKSVAVVTGLGYAFIKKGWITKLTERLYAKTNKNHDIVIFENEDDLDFFVSEKLLDSKNGFSVKGCGVDTKVYAPFPNGYKKSTVTFTFIGRLLYDKGIVEFVNAAKTLKKRYPYAEFWVVGELDAGNPSMVEKSKLLDWIDSGYIVYHGFVKDVRPLIAKSDCIVLPSYREGMPRIILEGMSMAKPVITTNTAGCRETVEEGVNGLLVDVKDVSGLSHAMDKIINMSYEDRHRMGQEGRKMVEEEFNSKKIAQNFYEIISNN